MNVHDSQWLASVLAKRGFAEAPPGNARIILVNTCSVRDKPEQKVLSVLGQIYKDTNGNPDVLVGVLGCVAQQLGESLFAKSPQLRLVMGSDSLVHAPDMIERLLLQPKKRIACLEFSKEYMEREKGKDIAIFPTAYVNIMQGCDNFCTYCIVPFTRGRQKSRTAEAILAECRSALARGAQEITLLGQNVNAFGKDKSGDGTSFSQLLQRVASLEGLQRLRYVTAHPKDMGPDDIAAFAALPQLCPRLHLPLQSGSNRILARMKRGYTREKFLELVRQLREARPELVLSTDLIVGFPGESEEDFQETLAMMRECAFVSSFSFCYSERPGTRAVLYPDKVPAATAQERLLRLQALQDELRARWLSSRMGEKTILLMEHPSPRQKDQAMPSWQGRDPYGMPVHVKLPAGSEHTGRMLPVTIRMAKKHSLLAALLENV
jgi:tRNA-2-methylthio-N6-dimethylallyladenosine synthase